MAAEASHAGYTRWCSTLKEMQTRIRNRRMSDISNNTLATQKDDARHFLKDDGVGQWVWLMACELGAHQCSDTSLPHATQGDLLRALQAAVHCLMFTHSRTLSESNQRYIRAVMVCKGCSHMHGAPPRSENLMSMCKAQQATWYDVRFTLRASPDTASFIAFWAWMGPTIKALCNGLLDMWDAEFPRVFEGFQTLEDTLQVFKREVAAGVKTHVIVTFSESAGGWVRVMRGYDNTLDPANPHTIPTYRIRMDDDVGCTYTYVEADGGKITGTLQQFLCDHAAVTGITHILPGSIPVDDAFSQPATDYVYKMQLRARIMGPV